MSIFAFILAFILKRYESKSFSKLRTDKCRIRSSKIKMLSLRSVLYADCIQYFERMVCKLLPSCIISTSFLSLIFSSSKKRCFDSVYSIVSLAFYTKLTIDSPYYLSLAIHISSNFWCFNRICCSRMYSYLLASNFLW